MKRLFLAIANRMSISDRLCLVTYMGGPLQAALPFRHRMIARLLLLWLRFNPQTRDGDE